MHKSLRPVVDIALRAIALVFALGQTTFVSADNIDGRWHDSWGTGHMFFGSFMMLLFWGVLILLIVLAVRWFSGGGSSRGEKTPSGSRALSILEERYARGEIDRAEFEERKETLSR